MNPSLLLKLFVTAVLLGFTVTAITLWALRSSLSGLVHVARRTSAGLPHNRLPLPRE
jgi:hypothetical protein